MPAARPHTLPVSLPQARNRIRSVPSFIPNAQEIGRGQKSIALSELPRRVLLVEPSPRECQPLRNDLLAVQMEVYTANDIMTALRALSIFQPSLILAQLRLPTYSGLELIRYIKQQRITESTPIILYSEITTAQERTEAFELGAADLLIKPFTPAELSARVRAALKAGQLVSLLQQQAQRDSLTGLANRALLDDQLLREWNAYRRRMVSLSVLMLDLDRFKPINDSFGHLVGDEVLRQTARLLASCARTSDLVARYGGEEFMVVAPDCPLSAAVALAKRVRAALHELTISVGDTDISVTASIGIATAGNANSPQELVHQADAALYQAKRMGRDAICVYDPSQGGFVTAVAAGLSIG